MADQLEPVVFEVLAEIASAQANLIAVREELTTTASEAAATGSQIAEAMTGVGGSFAEAASAAAETSGLVASSLAGMDASFGDTAAQAADAAGTISASLGDVESSLGDVAGAAEDSYGQISSAFNDIGSEAEAGASSIDDATQEMTGSFEEVGTAFEATASGSQASSAQIEAAMGMLAAAVATVAGEVVTAEAEMGDAAVVAGNKMTEEGAKARAAGAETAAGAHEGTAALKQMGEAFAVFAAFEFLKDSVKDAMNAEGAMNILNSSIEHTGASAKAFAPEIANVDEHMKALGFTAVQSNEGLAKLTQMTKSAEQATRLEGLAADLARAKHIDLGAAIRTVGMAATGHVGLLARLGLQTKDAAGHTLSAKAAIDAMAQSFSGTASAYAGTMQGKMDIFKADMEEAKEKVGTALIPALERMLPIFVQIANVIAKDVVPALASAAGFYNDHRKIINILVGIMAALWLSFKVGTALVKGYEFVVGLGTTALKLWKLATTEATAAELGLNGALLANPIGIVIALVVALAAVFVYAWKHSETFRNVVTGAWRDVEAAVGNAVGAIINNYIRPLVAAYLWMAQAVVGAANKAFGWIPGVGSALSSAQADVQNFASSVDSSLAGMASSASHWGSATTSAVTTAHAAVKKATADPTPFKDPSKGLSTTTPGAHAAAAAVGHHKKAHHAIEHGQAAHHKKMLAAAKAAAKKREEQLKAEVAAAKAAADAQNEILQKQLDEAENKFAFAEKQLEAQAHGTISFVNGQLANVGVSILNLGYAGSLAALGPSGAIGGGGGGTTVNVNVAGSVVTQQQLVSTIQSGLLTVQRTNANLGIT